MIVDIASLEHGAQARMANSNVAKKTWNANKMGNLKKGSTEPLLEVVGVVSDFSRL